MWDQYTDEEHHADVEDSNAPEHLVDGTWDCPTRIRRLAGGDAHHFSASIERASNDKGTCDTIDRIGERTRIVPVLKADLLWTNSAGRDGDGENEEDRNRYDFDSELYLV